MYRRMYSALLAVACFGMSVAALATDELPASFQELAANEANTLNCKTCETNCKARGLERGERYCTGPEGVVGKLAEGTMEVEGPARPVTPRELSGIGVTAARWDFTAVVKTLDATKFLSPVQAQQVLQGHARALLDCFEPMDYQASGSLAVNLYVSPVGTPVGVRGDTMGIRPLQARCMLAQAWSYRFPAPPTTEETASVRYVISFLTQKTYLETLSPRAAQLVVEHVRVRPRGGVEVSVDNVAKSLVEQARGVRHCYVLGLRELPDDLLVADVEMTFWQSGVGYQATGVDITLSNETGTVQPPAEMAECLRQNVANWRLSLPKDGAPGFETRFFLSFQAGQ